MPSLHVSSLAAFHKSIHCVYFVQSAALRGLQRNIKVISSVTVDGNATWGFSALLFVPVDNASSALGTHMQNQPLDHDND